jgi:hypothetical protein
MRRRWLTLCQDEPRVVAIKTEDQLECSRSMRCARTR